MFTQNLGWTLFIFGMIACGRSLVVAMRGCNVSNNGCDSSQNPLRIPRFIPRLFLLSYLSFTISYILQSIDLKLGSNVQMGEKMIVWFITLGLMGLPIYSAQVRMIFKHSFGNGSCSSSSKMYEYECYGDNEDEGERNLEGGVIKEEMRRDLRWLTVGHSDRSRKVRE
ncbi:hypothetical protein I204_04237 [Kwoniella mangroviensis CBS 8886]|nr:hypothetical protein I204_04237 [Kwoniella mangroviensis CBS 8886]